jgi:hypothetical protein
MIEIGSAALSRGRSALLGPRPAALDARTTARFAAARRRDGLEGLRALARLEPGRTGAGGEVWSLAAAGGRTVALAAAESAAAAGGWARRPRLLGWDRALDGLRRSVTLAALRAAAGMALLAAAVVVVVLVLGEGRGGGPDHQQQRERRNLGLHGLKPLCARLGPEDALFASRLKQPA